MRCNTLAVVAAVGIAAAIATGFLMAPGNADAQSTVTIESGNLYFCDPSFQDGICETTIIAGDTVIWDNVAGIHTVTECNEDFSVCPPEGGFDSGLLTDGDTYTLTFTSAGVFPYWCALHPIEMRGRIIVQEPTPTPSPPPAEEPTPTPEGQTPGPTPEATSTPAGVPATGALGPVAGDGSIWPAIALLAGLSLAIAGAGIALRSSTKGP